MLRRIFLNLSITSKNFSRYLSILDIFIPNIWKTATDMKISIVHHILLCLQEWYPWQPSEHATYKFLIVFIFLLLFDKSMDYYSLNLPSSLMQVVFLHYCDICQISVNTPILFYWYNEGECVNIYIRQDTFIEYHYEYVTSWYLLNENRKMLFLQLIFYEYFFACESYYKQLTDTISELFSAMEKEKKASFLLSIICFSSFLIVFIGLNAENKDNWGNHDKKWVMQQKI